MLVFWGVEGHRAGSLAKDCLPNERVVGLSPTGFVGWSMNCWGGSGGGRAELELVSSLKTSTL